MVSSTDFRTGLTIEIDGGVWQVVEFQHVKPGKGAAFVRTKIKNVETGAVIERTFNPNEKMPAARSSMKLTACIRSWIRRITSRRNSAKISLAMR